MPGETPATHLYYRGDLKQPRDEIAPADLTIATPPGVRFLIPAHDPQLPTTGRRLAWARHLVDGRHPLVGRVLVNRIWLHHFGRPLVDTPGDFGVLGSRPNLPELLDLLAVELVQEGWSLKRLHKQIMTSTVYRQSSHADPAKEAIDAVQYPRIGGCRCGGSMPKRCATGCWRPPAFWTRRCLARRSRSKTMPPVRWWSKATCRGGASICKCSGPSRSRS